MSHDHIGVSHDRPGVFHHSTGVFQDREAAFHVPRGTLRLPGRRFQIRKATLQVPKATLQIVRAIPWMPKGASQIRGGEVQLLAGMPRFRSRRFPLPAPAFHSRVRLIQLAVSVLAAGSLAFQVGNEMSRASGKRRNPRWKAGGDRYLAPPSRAMARRSPSASLQAGS